jgi:hypothetical protein
MEVVLATVKGRGGSPNTDALLTMLVPTHAVLSIFAAVAVVWSHVELGRHLLDPLPFSVQQQQQIHEETSRWLEDSGGAKFVLLWGDHMQNSIPARLRLGSRPNLMLCSVS